MKEVANKHIWMAWLSLWITMIYMHVSVISILGKTSKYGPEVFGYLFFSFLIVFLVLNKKKVAIPGLFLLLAGIGAYIGMQKDKFLEGLYTLAYYINEFVYDYNKHTVFPQAYTVQGKVDENLALQILCILCGIIIGILAFGFRQRILGFCLPMALFGTGLAFDQAPNIYCAILLVLGAGTGCSWIAEQKSDKGTASQKRIQTQDEDHVVRRYAVRFLGLVLVVICSLTFSYPVSKPMFQNAKQMQSNQIDIEKSLQMSIANFGQWVVAQFGFNSNGFLSNATPKYQEKVVMEVTVNHVPSGAIYLRGFVGDIYRNGHWKASKTVKKDKVRVSNRTWKGKYISNQFFQRDNTQEDIKITYIGKINRSRFRYLPYRECEALTELSEEASDYTAGHHDTPLHELDAYMQSYYVENVFAQADKVECVQGLLSQKARYSLTLDPLPSDRDYVEEFLFHSHKGYCEHFATAGTLMLRKKNERTRYVSGYIVEPDLFKKNKDGTYTAKVKDSCAHAWTEIRSNYYLLYDGNAKDMVKWWPVEMTPSYSSAGANSLDSLSFEEDDSDTDTDDFLENQNEEVIDDEEDADEPLPEETLGSEQDQEEDSQSLINFATNSKDPTKKDISLIEKLRILWSQKIPRNVRLVIEFVLGAALILLAACFVKKIRYHHWLYKIKEMRNQDPNYYVGMRIHLFLRKMRDAGIKVNHMMPEEEWSEILLNQQRLAIREEEMQRLLSLARMARFSKEKLSAKDVNEVDKLCLKWEKLCLQNKH